MELEAMQREIIHEASAHSITWAASVLVDDRNIYQETVEALGYDPLKKEEASASTDS